MYVYRLQIDDTINMLSLYNISLIFQIVSISIYKGEEKRFDNIFRSIIFKLIVLFQYFSIVIYFSYLHIFNRLLILL